jgi:transcriptional regulator with XRE-family HTH domain
MALETKKPREQAGRDSFARYRAQVRSAAIASLSILENKNIDRVYCDLHDDFVVRSKDQNGIGYLFYQVKTKGKSNHNWTLNEIFGLKEKIKDQSKQSTDKIKDSYIGKLLLHTVVFDGYCNAVVFQTNIHNSDQIASIISDVENGTFENKFVQVLVDRFCECYPEEISEQLSIDDIKHRISKLKFETDVQYLKDGDDNFEPVAKEKIFRFSEVDLGHLETKEILNKLLELVSKKSSGKIVDWNKKAIEEQAGISIEDLLSVLSISKDAYYALLNGGDNKAIKSASIIQRMLESTGASPDVVKYCSDCKTQWDGWYRQNRHVLPEIDLQSILGRVRSMIKDERMQAGSLCIADLRNPIKQLQETLLNEDILYDIDNDSLLGAVFSELIKGRI